MKYVTRIIPPLYAAECNGFLIEQISFAKKDIFCLVDFFMERGITAIAWAIAMVPVRHRRIFDCGFDLRDPHKGCALSDPCADSTD